MLAGTKNKVELVRKKIRGCDGRFTLRDVEFVDADPDFQEIGGTLRFKYPQAFDLTSWLEEYPDIVERAKEEAEVEVGKEVLEYYSSN